MNGVALATLGILLAMPAAAGTLTNVTAVASTNSPGATGVTYTLTFTTATAIGSTSVLLQAVFPNNVSLSGLGPSGAACAGSGVTITINGVPQNLATFLNACSVTIENIAEFDLSGSASVASGATVVITIPGGTNGNPFTASPFASFLTESDTANPLPTLGSGAPPPPPPVGTPTLSEWAFIALGLLLALLGYWRLQRLHREQT